MAFVNSSTSPSAAVSPPRSVADSPRSTSRVPMLVDYVAVYTANGGTTTADHHPADDQSTGRVVDAYSLIQAESFNAQSGVVTETTATAAAGRTSGIWPTEIWARYERQLRSSSLRDFAARWPPGGAGGGSAVWSRFGSTMPYHHADRQLPAGQHRWLASRSQFSATSGLSHRNAHCVHDSRAANPTTS